MKNATLAGIILILGCITTVIAVFTFAYLHDVYGAITLEQYRVVLAMAMVFLSGVGILCYGYAQIPDRE